MSEKRIEDNLSEEEIDKMISDLASEVPPMEKLLFETMDDLNRTYVTDHTEWDESSKRLHNHLFDRKISDLTIYEFTKLLRDVVRMELKEQISKINFTQYTPPPAPQQPWVPPLWEPIKPWDEPWVSCDSLQQRPFQTDITMTTQNIEEM